jgi:hypothetical protein
MLGLCSKILMMHPPHRTLGLWQTDDAVQHSSSTTPLGSCPAHAVTPQPRIAPSAGSPGLNDYYKHIWTAYPDLVSHTYFLNSIFCYPMTYVQSEKKCPGWRNFSMLFSWSALSTGCRSCNQAYERAGYTKHISLIYCPSEHYKWLVQIHWQDRRHPKTKVHVLQIPWFWQLPTAGSLWRPRITHPELPLCIQLTIPWSVCREST